jgi:hypothetical protein
LSDAVILAAEQIQDHRLSTLETAEVEVSDFLVSVLITFALESTLAGRLLSGITFKIMASVMSSPALMESLPVMMVEQTVRTSKSKVRDLTYLIDGTKKSLQSNASKVVEEYYIYSKTVFAMSNSATEQNLAAVAKSAYAGGQKFPRLPILPATDSPSVAIIEAVQRYASIQRITILSELSMLEAAVRLDILDIHAVNQFTKSELTEEETEIMNSLFRNRYKRLFEAVIWAKMLGFDTKNAPKIKRGAIENEIERVSTGRKIYFMMRFIDPETNKTFVEKYPDINKRNATIGRVHGYLTELGKKLEALRENTRSKSDGILAVVTPDFSND